MSYQQLSPPPLDSNITTDSSVTVPFRRYFTNINNTIEATIKPTTVTTGSGKKQGAVIQIPTFTTTEINSMENIADGSIVYDSVLHKFKFRENGAWVTYNV